MIAKILSNSFLIILVLALFLTGANCSNSVTKAEKAVAYGDNLAYAIDKFETNRRAFSKGVIDTVENANEELSEDKPDLVQIANDWEKEWESIINKFSELEERFSLVGKCSQEYFEKLEELESNIKNAKMRESEWQKNNNLKARWTREFEEASDNINAIRRLLQDGSDFHNVLIASSVRLKIEKNIEELKGISQSARQLLKELERFTIEGKKLISGNS